MVHRPQAQPNANSRVWLALRAVPKHVLEHSESISVLPFGVEHSTLREISIALNITLEHLPSQAMRQRLWADRQARHRMT